MGPALGVVIGTGLLWAALSVALHAGGHAPSATLVPIPREQYYLWQAFFVTPLVVAQWLVLSATAQGVARALGGRGEWGTTARGLAVAFALPLLVLFVLPDLLVYAIAGFDALASGMRIYGPAAAFVVLVGSTRVVGHVHDVSLPRAFVAALAGLVLQAVVAAPLLR